MLQPLAETQARGCDATVATEAVCMFIAITGYQQTYARTTWSMTLCVISSTRDNGKQHGAAQSVPVLAL